MFRRYLLKQQLLINLSLSGTNSIQNLLYEYDQEIFKAWELKHSSGEKTDHCKSWERVDEKLKNKQVDLSKIQSRL